MLDKWNAILQDRCRGQIVMGHSSEDENSKPPKKRVIEFDMFVRDLEPDNDEKVRGGGGKSNSGPAKPEKDKPDPK